MEWHIWMARLAWLFFVMVMMIRPLKDIFGWGICKKGMCYRKYLGILAGGFAVLHVVLFLWLGGLGVSYLWSVSAWNLGIYMGWGVLALLFIFPPLLTSNVFSQKKLKKHWKTVQKFSYPAFVLTGIHVALVYGRLWWGVMPLVVWVVLWLWARAKKNYNPNQP